MKKRQTINLDIDVAAGETVEGTIDFEGVTHRVIVTPETKREQLRKLAERYDGSRDPMISLGPRPGCPLCGR
jgi:hypothetical protein